MDEREQLRNLIRYFWMYIGEVPRETAVLETAEFRCSADKDPAPPESSGVSSVKETSSFVGGRGSSD